MKGLKELELRVAAVLLNQPNLLEANYVDPNWFENFNIRCVIDALCTLDPNERSLLNVFNEVQNKSAIKYSDLIKLQGMSITSANLSSDLKSIHKAYAERNLELGMQAYQNSKTKQELDNLSNAITELTKVDEEEDNGELDDAIEELKVRLTTNQPVGVKSYPKLDELLAGGLYGSMLFTIGARPSVGKTAYAVNLAYQILERDPEVQVDFFTLEMNKREMLNRFISRQAKVSSMRLKNPSNELTLAITRLISDGINWVRNHKLRIYDRILNLSGIVNVIRKNAAKSKPNKYVAIVDYIGLVKVNSRQDRWIQVGQITRELKILANEYNIPIVALAQLNRGVESRQVKEPMLSDLRESGSIEQDSNVVAFLYRPDEDDRSIVKLSIKKNREGQLGDISYYFEGQYMLFKEVDTE